MNSITRILTSSNKDNSRLPSNLNLKVQQSVEVMMVAVRFHYHRQIQIVCNGQIIGLQQEVLDLNHLLMETTISLFVEHDTQHWNSDYSPVTIMAPKVVAWPGYDGAVADARSCEEILFVLLIGF
ncbi:hypothetical protein WN943_000884 [Citrus x changshan-huyou]